MRAPNQIKVNSNTSSSIERALPHHQSRILDNLIANNLSPLPPSALCFRSLFAFSNQFAIEIYKKKIPSEAPAVQKQQKIAKTFQFLFEVFSVYANKNIKILIISSTRIGCSREFP
jgi:hypothetical protein